MNEDKLEILVKMLRLASRCGKNAKLELDADTCDYLYELILKDIIDNDIPISFDLE